jgi:hypothetical protein
VEYSDEDTLIIYTDGSSLPARRQAITLLCR